MSCNGNPSMRRNLVPVLFRKEREEVIKEFLRMVANLGKIYDKIKKQNRETFRWLLVNSLNLEINSVFLISESHIYGMVMQLKRGSRE